jgi:ubiquinone/menaquinone biosynthesis C-methylase UbiE
MNIQNHSQLSHTKVSSDPVLENSNVSKWNLAQISESRYFKQEYLKNDCVYIDMERSEYLAKEIIENVLIIDSSKNRDLKVIEIGCGPIGLIWGFKYSDLYGIDPLHDLYCKNSHILKLRKKKHVKYSKAQGEKINFDDKYFDLIICHNVLDHAENDEAVINEIIRITKDDGIIYLNVNYHRKMYKYIKYFFSRIGIYFEKHHPFCFTKSELLNIPIFYPLVIKKYAADVCRLDLSSLSKLIKSLIRKIAGKGYISIYLKKL